MSGGDGTTVNPGELLAVVEERAVLKRPTATASRAHAPWFSCTGPVNRFITLEFRKVREMRRIALAMLCALSVVTVCSCGGGGRQQSASSSTINSTSSIPGAASQTPSAPAEPISGIMLLLMNGNNCTVKVFNPDSGRIRDVANFNTSNYNVTGCSGNNLVDGADGGPGGAPLFSPDFTKMAVTANRDHSVGWIDSAGHFTNISSPQTPDFGLPSQPNLLGFDSRGDFYYDVIYGNAFETGWHNDMYRLTAGFSSGGQVIATINDTTPEPHELFQTMDGYQYGQPSDVLCPKGGGDSHAFYGADQKPWFFTDHTSLFRVDQDCDQNKGRAITPTTGREISNFIWSIDGSKVVFALQAGTAGLTNDKPKLFIVDGNGGGAPREITGPGVAAVLSPPPNTEIRFYSWI